MTEQRTIRVGITGGIGSGKSVVCRMFSMLGAPVYDSDMRAKELMVSDGELIENIKKAFGDEAYNGGSLNRAYLAGRVFNDPEQLARLNSIVHPAVSADFRRWADEQTTAPYVVIESAILFEAHLDRDVDYTVAVAAPDEVRIERAMGRDGATREKVVARIKNQMSGEQINARAGLVIENDGRSLVWEQVLALDARFRGRAE